MSTKSKNYDVSIKNLQSAIYQLRHLYEDLEQIVDQHDNLLDWMKAEISDKGLINDTAKNFGKNRGTPNSRHTSATHENQQLSSNSSSGSDSEEIFGSGSDLGSSRTNDNGKIVQKRRFFGL